MEAGPPLLSLKDVRVRFRTNDGIVEAVKGIDLTIRRNEVLAIVGESGSGKSQTMMALMGLLAANGEGDGDRVLRRRSHSRSRDGAAEALPRQCDHDDLPGADDVARSALPDRGADHAGDPRHQKVSREEARRKAVALLELVRIPTRPGG